MKFPWQQARRPASPAPNLGPQFVGVQFIDQAMKAGMSGLGHGPLDNIYRASLIGASAAVSTHLRGRAKLLSAWGAGDELRGSRVLEVWASSIAVTLLQNEPNQEAVWNDVAKGFAERVFNRSAIEPTRELDLVQRQLRADQAAVMAGGFYFPGKGVQLFQLRCINAIGIPVQFDRVTVPVPTGTTISQLDVVSPEYFPSIEDTMYVYSVSGALSLATSNLLNSGVTLELTPTLFEAFNANIAEATAKVFPAGKKLQEFSRRFS